MGMWAGCLTVFSGFGDFLCGGFVRRVDADIYIYMQRERERAKS